MQIDEVMKCAKIYVLLFITRETNHSCKHKALSGKLCHQHAHFALSGAIYHQLNRYTLPYLVICIIS